MNNTSTELITPAQLVERIGVAYTTLEQWRARNQGPAYIKVGRNVRYRVADVEAWLVSRTVKTGGAS